MRVPNKQLQRLGFTPKAGAPQMRGFNGIIPYQIEGVPDGALEMGLGAVLGFAIGASRGQGLVGALFGLAAGSVLGQVQLKSTAAGSSGAPQGYLVTKQPGTTPAGATPDKAGSGFDWNGAANIVQGLLLDSKRISDVKNIMDLVSRSWGSDTAKVGYSTGPMASENYLPWKGEDFYTDPCANGCVKIDNSSIAEVSVPDETYTGPGSIATPAEEPWY